MKKFVSILVVMLALFVFSTPSFAWFDGGDDVTINNQGGDGGNATATGGNVVNSGNSCVMNNNNAKNYNTDINNNSVRNYNTDINNNTNKQKQQQGQIQGQLQGQLQGQDQGQDQGQEQGQMNNWTQIYEDKRDHIQGPGLVQSDAKLQRGKPFTSKVRLIKEFMSNIDELSVAQAKKLASKASDITCEPALIMENEFSTNKVKCQYFGDKAPGDFMGYLYMGSDGGDVNTPSMIGEAAKKALRAGATHMRLIFVDAGESNNGDSWNIGLGGGASIMANGDATAIAPNGGLGIGHADSFSELRPEMVFELTFDSSLTANYKLSKAELGYSASSIEVTQLR